MDIFDRNILLIDTQDKPINNNDKNDILYLNINNTSINFIHIEKFENNVEKLHKINICNYDNKLVNISKYLVYKILFILFTYINDKLLESNIAYKLLNKVWILIDNSGVSIVNTYMNAKEAFRISIDCDMYNLKDNLKIILEKIRSNETF